VLSSTTITWPLLFKNKDEKSTSIYIAKYKLPRAVAFCDQLPVTPTGKLLRRVLKQWDKENKYPTIRISE